MKTLITSKQIADNQFVFVAELASKGGGKFKHPGVLRLMKTDKKGLETFNQHARIMNNKGYEQIDYENVDLRCKGPRSGYARKLIALVEQMNEIH